jgi:hypothetical protein
MRQKSNDELLIVLRRCLQLVQFNKELHQHGPTIIELQAVLSKMIANVEAPQPVRPPAARRRRPKKAPVPPDGFSSNVGW